jgi:hypothetical protein
MVWQSQNVAAAAAAATSGITKPFSNDVFPKYSPRMSAEFPEGPEEFDTAFSVATRARISHHLL